MASLVSMDKESNNTPNKRAHIAAQMAVISKTVAGNKALISTKGIISVLAFMENFDNTPLGQEKIAALDKQIKKFQLTAVIG